MSPARWLLADGCVAVPGSWLDLDPYQSICRSSQDAFDPVIAGLAARVAAIGLATRPAHTGRGVADVEGWVVVATAELGQRIERWTLCSARQQSCGAEVSRGLRRRPR
jgi:hypothetical protein